MADRPMGLRKGPRESKGIDQPMVNLPIVRCCFRCCSCLSDRPMCH